MAEIEYSRRFRFWESALVSGALYHLGRFFKRRSPKKIALFYEKFCEKAEEGTWEIFQEAEQKNPGHAYFLINRDSADYERLKENPRVVPQFSARYYWLLFRASSYISTEAPTHLSVLRSNNRYFRKSIADNAFIFLQHGITYLKCQGKNSTFVYGREDAPFPLRNWKLFWKTDSRTGVFFLITSAPKNLNGGIRPSMNFPTAKISSASATASGNWN